MTIGPGNAIFDTNGHDATWQGAITGGSSSTEFHKIGTGTLTLTGNNTYTGQLQIIAGTLILTGDNQPSITSTPISTGATLQIGNGGATGSLSGNEVPARPPSPLPTPTAGARPSAPGRSPSVPTPISAIRRVGSASAAERCSILRASPRTAA